MLLGELIQGLPIDLARGGQVRVCDLTEDSRTALPGSLFVARRGRTTDGLSYVRDAARAGACAVLTHRDAEPSGIPPGVALALCDDVPLMTALLAERLSGMPSKRLLLVGVTGTNGKTTVTHIIHQILNRCGVRCGMIGTVEVDDGREIAPSPMTTPPAIELSRTLANMVEAGCHAAVMEVSSHALDQKRADALSFDAAVFTNVSGDHQDYHDSFEAYVAAKRRLPTLVDEATGGPTVLNRDDPVVRATHAGRPVWCSASAIVEGWSVRRDGTSLDGERLIITGPETRIAARVALFGAHNAMNALQGVAAAWAILDRAGVEPRERAVMIARALTLVHPPRGRLEPVHGAGDDVGVFVDFAHSDDALVRALEAVRSAKPAESRLWVVFGCGGERDRSKRSRMGLAAATGADRVVVTSDNPRAEPPSRIVADVLEGVPGSARGRLEVHIDRARAIHAAIAQAEPGDVVVIAGKGHETEQIGVDETGARVSRRFVDQEVAARALAERRSRTARAGEGMAV